MTQGLTSVNCISHFLQTTSTPAAPVSSAAPRRPSATLGKAAAAPPATTTFSLLDAPPASNPSHSSKTSIQTNPGSGNVPNLNPANAGGGLFDLDFSPSASAAAVTATAPAARKDVKNDILSLFASKPSIPYGPTLPTTTQPAGNLGGLHQQFGGLQMSSPTGPAVGSQNDTWGQFGGSGNTTQSNDTFNSSSSAFGFGGSNQVRLSSHKPSKLLFLVVVNERILEAHYNPFLHSFLMFGANTTTIDCTTTSTD